VISCSGALYHQRCAAAFDAETRLSTTAPPPTDWERTVKPANNQTLTQFHLTVDRSWQHLDEISADKLHQIQCRTDFTQVVELVNVRSTENPRCARYYYRPHSESYDRLYSYSKKLLWCWNLQFIYCHFHKSKPSLDNFTLSVVACIVAFCSLFYAIRCYTINKDCCKI